MNKYFVNTIYKQLSKAIDEGYKSGIKSIVKLNKKKFDEGVTDKIVFADDPVFSIDYTGKDTEAIKNFKINAFKVAGVGTWELEEELKDLGVTLLDSEVIDYDTFELQVRDKMIQYGIGLGDQPPGGWIKQNIDTAIKNSIAGARWNRANDPELNGLYTAWIYKTQQDERVREEHAALDGQVFSMDDATGAQIFPPNDWGCRCYEEYLTGAEAESYDLNTPEQSQELLREVPEDFRYNPGSGKDVWKRWLDQKLHQMPEEEYTKLKSLIKNQTFK